MIRIMTSTKNKPDVFLDVLLRELRDAAGNVAEHGHADGLGFILVETEERMPEKEGRPSVHPALRNEIKA